jgi:hypothetical protein
LQNESQVNSVGGGNLKGKGGFRVKKMTLVLLINFVLASNVFSYSVITDPNVFYAFFEQPAKVIDFTELKDGTSYHNIPGRLETDTFEVSEPDCINNQAGDIKALTVWSNAFSNAWSFRGSDPVQAHALRDEILWFDQGITTGDCSMAVSTNAERSQPFAMYTNKGFMGIIPDTPQETLFIFENLHFIFSFETEFAKTAPVSESKTSFLALVEIN